MTDCRLTPELILDIAEHCDRPTLAALMQTSKYIHALISGHECSIVTAKFKDYLLQPLGEVLSSKDEHRRRVPGGKSFATLQELDLRERRITSILNHSGFLLTDKVDTLGLDVTSLTKFKAGLKRAFYLTDRLADLETQLSGIEELQKWLVARLSRLYIGSNRASDAGNTWALALHLARIASVLAHQDNQREMIRNLDTTDLAWLLTLGEGAMKGCARYCVRRFESDPRGTEYRVMAFKEELLRKGPFVMWAFVRGVGSMHAFITKCMKDTGEEIRKFEMGEHRNFGLSSTIHQEMKRRILKELSKEKGHLIEDECEAAKPEKVMAKVHGIVAKEIGYIGWGGYRSIVIPP